MVFILVMIRHPEVFTHAQNEIDRVSEETRALAKDSDNSALWFDEYGTDWISNTGPFIIPMVSGYTDE